MVNTRPNPLMKGDGPCTVKMIRRAVEGFRQPDDFRQLSPSATASGKSALPLRGHPPPGRARAEGEGEMRIFGVDSGHSHAAVLGTLLGRAL